MTRVISKEDYKALNKGVLKKEKKKTHKPKKHLLQLALLSFKFNIKKHPSQPIKADIADIR